MSYENGVFSNGRKWLAGVDEVGRGALAGPVVAAAAVLTLPLAAYECKGVKDSKLLSQNQREHFDEILRSTLPCWSIGEASVEEIERLNIRVATLLAMKRAISGLPVVLDVVLVDGKDLIPDIGAEQRAIPSGDKSVFSIAAASILAKVYRDRLMVSLDETYRGYSFSKNKGYGTQDHRKGLIEKGLSPIHRIRFCKTFLSSTRDRSLFPENDVWNGTSTIS